MRLALVLLAFPLLARTLVGQDRWERQVEERMSGAIAAVEPAAHRQVVRRVGMLNTAEGALLQTTLVAGHSYAILALCDDDCSRLELTLLKPSDSEIAKERNGESLPFLHFTSDTTMTYRVRVIMDGCRWNPCRYAVAVVPLSKGVASR